MFLQARNVLENGGIVVCRANHVELAGGTSNAVSTPVHVHVVHTCLYMYMYQRAECDMVIPASVLHCLNCLFPAHKKQHKEAEVMYMY